MGEMKEWWSNVYLRPDWDGFGPDTSLVGARYEDRAASFESDQPGMLRARYRLHVRLKPEGAPKRYRNDMERQGWETEPATMRRVAKIVEANSGLFPSA